MTAPWRGPTHSYSDEVVFVTGANVRVDGGKTAVGHDIQWESLVDGEFGSSMLWLWSRPFTIGPPPPLSLQYQWAVVASFVGTCREGYGRELIWTVL